MSHTPARFKIYWRNEVVRAEVADALLTACELVMDKSGHFYDCLPGKRGQAPSDDCSHVCKAFRAALGAMKEKS